MNDLLENIPQEHLLKGHSRVRFRNAKDSLDVVKEGQGRAVALAALGPLRGAGGLSEGASVYIRGRYQMSYIYSREGRRVGAVSQSF